MGSIRGGVTRQADRPGTYGCQACGAPLDLRDAGGAAALRCRFCGAFTRLPAAPRMAALRPAAERPRSIEVVPTARGLELVRRWWSPLFLFLAFFCVVWNGIVFAFFGMASRAGAPWFVSLFPLIHVAVGLGLAYFTLCGFLNRTRVTVERHGTVAVTHGPLPWRGTPTLEAASIAQVYVVRKTSTTSEGKPTSSYRLCALGKDGARTTLLALPTLTLEEALFVEEEVERHLGLADVPVMGEVPRDDR